MNELTAKEISDLNRHIATLKSFTGALEAGEKALIDIRDRKLYRHKYKTIEELCEKELGWTKQRYYQLLEFRKIKKGLPPKSQQLLTREGQSRALKNIPEDKRAEVLEKAAESGKVTAKTITAAAKIIQIDVIERDREDHEIPLQAMPTWNRRDEVDEYLIWISRIKSWAEKLQKSSDKFYAVKEFSAQEVFTDCGNLYRMIKSLVPYSICPVCQGQTPKACALCHGKAMISKHTWDHGVDSNTKKMMKAKAKHDTSEAISATGN